MSDLAGFFSLKAAASLCGFSPQRPSSIAVVESFVAGWTSSLEPAAQADAIELLDQVLMTVVRMPSATETTCSVGFLQAQAMSFNLDVKLTQRQGDVKAWRSTKSIKALRRAM